MFLLWFASIALLVVGGVIAYLEKLDAHKVEDAVTQDLDSTFAGIGKWCLYIGAGLGLLAAGLTWL